MKKTIFVLLALLLTFTTHIYSQDARELLYNFEILAPNHALKPKVEGFAKERVEDKLDRGVIAIEDENNNVFISWRLLKDDPEDITFDVYRMIGGKSFKLNRKPILSTNNFVHKKVDDINKSEYWVVPSKGKYAGQLSERVSVVTKVADGEPAYISIPLQDDVVPGRRRLGVADLNGDGKFDFILIQPNVGKDPGFRADSSQVTYKIEAYLNDGTFLWRNDLGDGIEPGVWYSPFIAYDFDGDGKA